MDFVAGQRWVSHTEAQLGLGIVSSVADRLITVSFPAVEEERSYAAKSAPLSRVIYKVGDEIATQDGKQLIIEEILENNGLLIYFASDTAGESHIVPELQLDCFVQFTSPLQRLFSSQLDSGDVFQLRVKTLHQKHRLQQSGVTGLLGSRTSLLAHQVYIANEVAQRYAPRVLLADEVGLGKTIEAGLIIHAQRVQGRAERVFVPVFVDLAKPVEETGNPKSWPAVYGTLALACLLAGAVVFKKQVIETVPALEKAYQLTGLQPDGNGLSIRNVVTKRRESGGVTQLIVRGEVENISTGSISVPPIAVTIRGKENTPLYVWKVAPGQRNLKAGEKRLFTGISQVFPGDAKDVHLDFVKPGH